eukprot:TRINITY_DN34575_c0_g1_i1.p1 TRINITY_DN34575_c0_g1~~TRINITY_DN34575_c0_g1_i1.p1  ORF type:complete len:194 (+),score=35.11 TRINITY_DN34575_c0_g1_i1:64-645(+)
MAKTYFVNGKPSSKTEVEDSLSSEEKPEFALSSPSPFEADLGVNRAGCQRRLVLFDGQCRLCLGFVAIVVGRDSSDLFRFAPLQSPLGQKVLAYHELPKDLDSVVLHRLGRAFTHSDAALEVIGDLDGIVSGLWGLKAIPKVIRDWGYDLVAKSRFMLLGHSSVSETGDEAITAKLVDTWEPDPNNPSHICSS